MNPIPFVLALAAIGYALWTIRDKASTVSDVENDTDANGLGAAIDDGGNLVNYPNTIGFRNNNPMNLRYIATDPYNGQIGNNGGYGVYSTLSAGIRAGGLQLTHDYSAGMETVQALISSWAPTSENDTQAYIADVANRMNVSPTQVLGWPADAPELVNAIIIHENGSNPIPIATIIEYLNS
jgi:hypothetical protein